MSHKAKQTMPCGRNGRYARDGSAIAGRFAIQNRMPYGPNQPLGRTELVDVRRNTSLTREYAFVAAYRSKRCNLYLAATITISSRPNSPPLWMMGS
jgi:hypothetical protein